MAGKRSAADERQHIAEHIHRLLGRLGWIWPAIVVGALALFAAGAYVLQARPLARSGAEWRVQSAAEEMRGNAARLVVDLERLLLACQEWTRSGLIGVSDPAAFNRQLVPLVSGWPVSAVQLANDEGRAMLLLRTADGWANRVTDVPRAGQQQRWTVWKDVRTKVSEQWRKEDWDPRQRPWYTSVMIVPELQVVWMAPHVLQGSGEPVISASVRWYDDRGHQWVVSLSIDLVALSRFMTQQAAATQTRVALLTGDGKLLAASRSPLFESPEAIRQSLLQEPEKLGLRVLASAVRHVMRQRAGAGPVLAIPAEDSGDGQEWLVSAQTLSAGGQDLRIVALAPVAEAVVVTGRQGAFLALIVAVIAGLSALVGNRLSRSGQDALARAFARVEEKRGQAERQEEMRNTVAAITLHMQQAGSPAELARSLLGELAPRLQLGQAMFCLWDESGQGLRVAATYAGEGGQGWSPGDEVPEAHGGLLAQCARDRRVIVLRGPGTDYLRVRSGLGDAAPAEITLIPVQYGDRLFGVMELASMRELSDDDRLLLADLETIIALNLDILLRAQRAADLLAQTAADEERHRLILGAVADGIWGMDADGRTSFVNRTALELLGFSEAEVLGRDMHALVHARYPDGREYPAAACPICRTALDGVPQTVDEEVFWHKDGHPVHVEYSTTALHRQNAIVGVVVVFRDIGERQAVEQQRRENEALLWQTVEDSPAAAGIVTEEGRMLRYNKRLLEVLGVPPEHFETHTIADSWEHPEERGAFVEVMKKNGVVRNYRTRFRRGDGAVIPVVISSRLVTQGSQHLLLSWLVEDVPGGAGGAA